MGAACTTCDDRDTKGKGVVRAFAALRAVRGRRKPGGPLPVVLKPAAPAVQSERGEEERPDDRPKCPNGHELEFDEVLGSEDYCDRCDGIFSRFARMQKCFLCQYSLCELCYVTERGEIREELKRKFRYIEKEDKRLEEEERRPPPVVLKGRVGEPAVPRERGGTSATSARRVAKAEAESKVDWPEAPPPPPPPGKPRSRRTREVEKEKEKDEDDEESPPPPPPGKPPRSVKSSRNKMGNEAEGVPLSLRRPQSPRLRLLRSLFLGVHGSVRSAMVSMFRTRRCVDISLKVVHVLGRFGRRPNGLHMLNLRYREVRGRKDVKKGAV